MPRQRRSSLNPRNRTKRRELPRTEGEPGGPAPLESTRATAEPAEDERMPTGGFAHLASTTSARARTRRALEAQRNPAEEPQVLRIPVLAAGVDPGKVAPSPLAVQDRLVVDRRLVADHAPERLFAYDVTLPAMKHLRGLASPGDRIVFQRGGRVSADRICAVRTPDGIVLARVLFKGRSLLLLPGEGERDFDSVDVESMKALPGVIAGTHVLLLRR
jgi:hypothetical protein